MTFREKIDKIKAIRRLSVKKLGEKSTLGGTLEKAYTDNREMKPVTTAKFLQNLGINPDWWGTGKGDIFLPVMEINQEKERDAQDDSGVPNEEWYKKTIDKLIHQNGEAIGEFRKRDEKEILWLREMLASQLKPPQNGQ